MKKNSFIYNDEINLIALFKIIWDGKIKILLITIISFLIGFWYNSQIPINYLNSLKISNNSSIDIIKVDNIYRLIESELAITSIPKNYLVNYLDELKDYEEFLLNLKNTKKIQENFSKLNIENQEIKLFQYVKLFEIVELKEGEVYTINFKWNDPNEAKKILQDTLNLTSKNFTRFINQELLEYVEFEKKKRINKDNIRLVYLKEQSTIAQEQDITDNQIDNLASYQSNLLFSIDSSNVPYYLMGTKAINKEIALIQNRNYQNLKFIELELDNFNKKKIKWINYNIHLMDTKLLKNTRPALVISILLGLIVGLFYVLISNAFQTQTSFKKR